MIHSAENGTKPKLLGTVYKKNVLNKCVCTHMITITNKQYKYVVLHYKI